MITADCRHTNNEGVLKLHDDTSTCFEYADSQLVKGVASYSFALLR
jgi:hypothetical protein